MDFFKKIGKEVSVFGLVFVVFIALFAYRQATHVELSTISQDKFCLLYTSPSPRDCS